MRLHCVSFPHTDTTRQYCYCAYTEKQRKLGAMLHAYGHELILYAGEENEAECAEHVVVAGAADRKRWFGGPWNDDVVFDRWDPADVCWEEMNRTAIRQIAKRIQPGDAIGLAMGVCQARIADAFAGVPILEWGIGYGGVLDRSFKAFESHAHQNFVHGWRRDDQGSVYDTVIPNSVEVADFDFSDTPDDYLLFLGRMTPRKGLATVAELAKHYPVLTAGQGSERVERAAHLGLVRGAERAELLAKARAVIVATEYLEPFGGVAVEAMVSGAPVLTTDFGAFPETVDHGVTGFRCSTVDEFLKAAGQVDQLDRSAISMIARSRFSTEAVAPMYDRWIGRIMGSPEYARSL